MSNPTLNANLYFRIDAVSKAIKQEAIESNLRDEPYGHVFDLTSDEEENEPPRPAPQQLLSTGAVTRHVRHHNRPRTPAEELSDSEQEYDIDGADAMSVASFKGPDDSEMEAYWTDTDVAMDLDGWNLNTQESMDREAMDHLELQNEESATEAASAILRCSESANPNPPSEDHHEAEVQQEPSNADDQASLSDQTSSYGAQERPDEDAVGSDGVFWERDVDVDDPEDIRWIRFKRCPRCRSKISLGLGKSLHSFNSHEGSKACDAQVARNEAEHRNRNQRSIQDFFKKRPTHSPAAGESTATSVRNPDHPEERVVHEASGTVERPWLFDDDSDEEANDVTARRDEDGFLEPPNGSGATRDENVDGQNRNAAPAGSTTCAGSLLTFPGSIYQDYPFHLHHYENLPYHFCGVESLGSQFRIRSNDCYGLTRRNESVCLKCNNLDTGVIVNSLRDRASGQLSANVNYRYRSFAQLCSLLREKNETINNLKLNVRGIASMESILN